MPNTAKKMVAGAVGGLVGSLAMGAVMAIGKQTGVLEPPAPLQIEREVERRIGLAGHTDEREEMVLASIEHLLVGVVYGAGYGLLRERLDLEKLPVGMAYGLGVYAVNYAGVGPALDLTAGPWDNEMWVTGRRVMMHLLFGTVTAGVTERLLEGGRGAQRPAEGRKLLVVSC